MTAKLLEVEKNDPKAFWNLVKKMRNWGKQNNDPSKSIPPSEWLYHFQELFREKHQTCPNVQQELNECEGQPAFSELDFRISPDEITLALSRLKGKASTGKDNISGNLLKHGQNEILPALKIIFNTIFTNVSYPKIWAEKYLIPILKKGDNSDPHNYRGIAVGSSLSKLYSLILLNRLEKRLQTEKLLSPHQIGFIKGHRTADHIFVLSSIVNKIVKKERKNLYVAFIDFQKAYDTINRNLLFLKLQQWNINGLFYKNIKSLYDSVNYSVKVEGGYLETITSHLGLIQGGILSPILFNIFIDDIRHAFDESCHPVMTLGTPISHILYADDLVLLSTTESGLKACLDKLSIFCLKWQLTLNPSKSKIIIFNHQGRLLRGNFTFNNQTLEIVKSYTYLGLEITASGSYTAAKVALMEKARKAMMPLISTVAQFHMPINYSLHLFDSFVKPIALYNAENWAVLTTHQRISLENNSTTILSYLLNIQAEKVHLKYLKYLLGVKKSCSNHAVLGELGRIPLVHSALVRLLTFWHRISLMPKETLVNLTYMGLDPDCDWMSTVKYLLKVINLDQIFENPSTYDTNRFKNICSKKLKMLIVSQWEKYVNSVKRGKRGSKLVFYKKIKSTFYQEPYISILSNFQHRKLVAKLRCSDHDLQLEKGRHTKTNRADRLCKMCGKQVETEPHFLVFCPKFNKIRKATTNNFNHDWLNFLKSKEENKIFALAQYLEQAKQMRDQT